MTAGIFFTFFADGVLRLCGIHAMMDSQDRLQDRCEADRQRRLTTEYRPVSTGEYLPRLTRDVRGIGSRENRLKRIVASWRTGLPDLQRRIVMWTLVDYNSYYCLNEGTGIRELSCDPEDLPRCDRCGKQHGNIYTVEDGNGKRMNLGSTCCRAVVGRTFSDGEAAHVVYANLVAKLRPVAEMTVGTWTDARKRWFLQSRGWGYIPKEWSTERLDRRIIDDVVNLMAHPDCPQAALLSVITHPAPIIKTV